MYVSPMQGSASQKRRLVKFVVLAGLAVLLYNGWVSHRAARRPSSGGAEKSGLKTSAQRQDGTTSKDVFAAAADGEDTEGAAAAAGLLCADPNDCKPQYEHAICIIGNAEKPGDARKMHDMWGGAFRSFWAVWGSEGPAASTTEGSISLLRIAGNAKSSWAEGIEFAYATARASTTCEYYFTHDDDLRFYPTLEAPAEPRPIWQILRAVLARYRPAVAAFPWQHGDATIPAMREMAALAGGAEVSPLTGFDSGMVLYHESIADFYIPFAPRGEGGFTGKWSLCAVFLNLFTARTFRGSAVRINVLQYDNLINIDNVPEEQRGKAVAMGDGTVKHPESRHPYEYRYNAEYSRFVAEGLRDPQARQGRALAPADVTWAVAAGRPPFDRVEVAAALASFYDLNHPAIKHNAYLKSRFSAEERRALLAGTPYVLSLHLFVADPNRRAGFERLWASLGAGTQRVAGQTLETHIHLAWAPTPEGDAEREEPSYLSLFNERYASSGSPHATVTVHPSLRAREPRTRYLEAWAPRARNEFGVFLDADGDNGGVALADGVSPEDFFAYIDRTVRALYYAPDEDAAAAEPFGFSLAPVTQDEYHGRPFVSPASTSASASAGGHIALQAPDAVAGVYSGVHWARFLDWYLANKDTEALIPYSLANRWMPAQTWRKYLYRYLHDEGLALVFPPPGTALLLPQTGAKNGTSQSIPAAPASLAALPQFNSSYAAVPALSRHEPNNFDKCTMVITVYDRYMFITDRLKHYHTLPCLDAIVIIWNNLKVEPVEIPRIFKVPVYIMKQTVNSMNNRFKPYAQIKTRCIINMDDDWDMPHAHVEYVVSVWQKQFFGQLVGFKHQGRDHVVGKDGKYLYSTDNRKYVSMVLPSGFVYDAKFLHQYTDVIPAQLRRIVDRDMNCDDILFNLMVSHYNHQGPVVVDYHAKVMDIGFNGGLWKQGSHFNERTQCLNEMSAILGEMPLRYTNYFFTRESVLAASKHKFDVPALADIKWIAKLPAE